MKDVIQSNSGVTHKNGVKANHAGGKHKGVKEGINAPSQQTIVQPKLELTTPGDSYEREADRMADFVMRKAYSGLPTEMPSTSSVLPPMISRRASSSTSGVAVDNATESGIHASRGGGQPMPTALRSQMESGFEADFSGVRLHTGSAAEAMSNNLRAKAFTYGNDIYFNRGQYSPDTTEGQHLIAHELTHVVQQSGKVGRQCPGCEARAILRAELELKRDNDLKKLKLKEEWDKKMTGNSYGLIFNGKYLYVSDMRGDEINIFWRAVSGRDECMSNKNCQKQKNKGPIPEGTYTLGETQTIKSLLMDEIPGLLGKGCWPGGSYAWGNTRTWLKPDNNTNTYGRKGFSIHGGSTAGSAGCIDLTSENDEFHTWLGLYREAKNIQQLIVKY
ncbi:MAG: eCIS core domain-containing protein [Tannerella sp.]|uniref:eCIS core domain-containing protein n=1 Tax=Tannerella sp. TaxID=2382127 RepID=UPI003FA335A5